LKVNLNFKSMDDFEPESVARQVKPLKELLDLRTKLADLRGAMMGNDKLDELLLGLAGDADKLAKVKAESNAEGGSNE